MTRHWPAGNFAEETYDAYAADYEAFNQGYQYKRWTGRLLACAEAAGLAGKRLLDVGCGTGLSFVALQDRGWDVTGVDISEEMLIQAREKAGPKTKILQQDMRSLPQLGEFDLVWAVNDALNYLLSTDELRATLTGMRQNLAPDGIVLFDVNTLACYRLFFGAEHFVEVGRHRFHWEGQANPAQVSVGSVVEAHFEDEGQPNRGHVHRQRHFGETEMTAALGEAGLRTLAIYGELDGELEPGFDEEINTKAVYLATASV